MKSKINLFGLLFFVCMACLHAQMPYNFYSNLPSDCAYDPDFKDQWNLYNDGFGIKACAAWQLSTGNGVVVALIDNGIKDNPYHLDLKNNIYPNALHPISYDVETGGAQRLIGSDDGHGTICAGILCAERNNGKYIAGVAPDSKLMSISFRKTSSHQDSVALELNRMAKGIGWAWRHGAHVISVSRSHNIPSSPSSPSLRAAMQALKDTIHLAVTQGRGGLGAVVVYSSGNTSNNDTINYPSRLSDVISVGGMLRSGTHCETSNCGYGLDVVAPNEAIPSLGLTEGYERSPECYTSVACPHVSGIAALILSIRPDLTQVQVRYIIESTCTKLQGYTFNPPNSAHPNGTWNNEMGYGLVNACAAVNAAQCYNGISIINGTITQSATWTTSVLAVDDIIIPNGVTLTIKTQVKCANNATFIVKPGGKLVIDNGTLTAACPNQMWQGIVVLGTRNQPQTAQYQGTVELKNGAIIEHANCAISAAPTGYYNQDGGIIKATDAKFLNNWRAIEYCSYENKTTSETIIDNVGKFVNCTFTIDDNKRFATPLAHVTMWDVRGVTFQACTFENNTTRPRLKEGISTVDAGFRIINRCAQTYPYIDCTCYHNPEPCSFKSFDNAIHSVNSGTSRLVYIDQSNFDNNATGVRMEEQPNFRLTRCKFTNIYDFGLVSVNSSGYKIEENEFNSTGPNMGANAIRMSNSGSAANRIYKNYFNNLHQGIFIHSVNGSTTQGLQFLCNAFDGNNYDVHIWNSTTVRPNQGSLSAGADNKFENTHISSIHSQSATSAQTITYYRNPRNVRPDPYEPYNPTSNITINRTATPNPCASTFCYGDGTRLDIDSLEQYKAMQAQYDYLLANLDDNPELLQDLLVLSDAMRELSDHAISRILQDSILYLDALKSWYEVVRTPIAKYWLSETYASEKKYEQAEAILREIPAKFAFSESELIEHENYMQFYNFKKKMLLSDRNWTQLDEAEIAQLQRIAEATNGRSAGMAKGVLCFFFDICYEDKIEEGGEGENGAPSKSAEVETDNYPSLQIYPNPTQSEIAITTNNPAVKIVQTEIYDLTNRKAHQQTVNQSYSTLQLNELAQGVYILKVWLDNGDMVVKKIVKQ